jgi:TPR repeat protein
MLKTPSKFSLDGRKSRSTSAIRWKGTEREADMARIDVGDLDAVAPGEAPLAETFFELGMMYSTGRSVPMGFIIAHKWFNLAAIRGNEDATRLRREIADQMSETEIAAAQRAARDWVTAH